MGKVRRQRKHRPTRKNPMGHSLPPIPLDSSHSECECESETHHERHTEATEEETEERIHMFREREDGLEEEDNVAEKISKESGTIDLCFSSNPKTKDPHAFIEGISTLFEESSASISSEKPTIDPFELMNALSQLISFVQEDVEHHGTLLMQHSPSIMSHIFRFIVSDDINIALAASGVVRNLVVESETFAKHIANEEEGVLTLVFNGLALLRDVRKCEIAFLGMVENMVITLLSLMDAEPTTILRISHEPSYVHLIVQSACRFQTAGSGLLREDLNVSVACAKCLNVLSDEGMDEDGMANIRAFVDEIRETFSASLLNKNARKLSILFASVLSNLIGYECVGMIAAAIGSGMQCVNMLSSIGDVTAAVLSGPIEVDQHPVLSSWLDSTECVELSLETLANVMSSLAENGGDDENASWRVREAFYEHGIHESIVPCVSLIKIVPMRVLESSKSGKQCHARLYAVLNAALALVGNMFLMRDEHAATFLAPPLMEGFEMQMNRLATEISDGYAPPSENVLSESGLKGLTMILNPVWSLLRTFPDCVKLPPPTQSTSTLLIILAHVLDQEEDIPGLYEEIIAMLFGILGCWGPTLRNGSVLSSILDMMDRGLHCHSFLIIAEVFNALIDTFSEDDFNKLLTQKHVLATMQHHGEALVESFSHSGDSLDPSIASRVEEVLENIPAFIEYKASVGVGM
eukprot:TRINITY_DN33780_c0_g1_i1.p1 TRINITY_DN33780_c0_g1~~TRINITY_DN33780_c0_g1_i1.p1  ORF type:complete len:693 (+),score=214.02 TRINITY_DN33780_c0_g1_i1:75-2153(+)